MEKAFSLITGASQGIGAAFAVALAKRRKDLILVARNKAKLDTLAQQLQQHYAIEVKTIELDLARVDAADQLLALLKDIDIETLINNAGVGMGGEFFSEDVNKLESMIHLNILTLTKLTRYLLPKLEALRGNIINVASTAAFQPLPYMTVYAATKAYVLSFSEALHSELKDRGVYVLALCPGPTKTGFFDAAQIKLEDTRFSVQPVEEVVQVAMDAWDAKKSVAIPGLMNKLTVFSVRLSPRTLVVWIARKFMGH